MRDEYNLQCGERGKYYVPYWDGCQVRWTGTPEVVPITTSNTVFLVTRPTEPA
jgi:hypothetical protein